MRHGKNITPFKLSYKELKLPKETRTVGNTFGGNPNTLLPSSTSCTTTAFSHQDLSFGFGILNVQTK
jgi:hypothetical protein